MQQDKGFDILIIGAGGAGLSLALNLAAHHRVAVLSKSVLTEANTFYAQGGIAAVLHDEDSIEAHVQDTLVAGAGLCDEAMVRFVVEQGPAAIHWLSEQGVGFTAGEGAEIGHGYHLTREGGHRNRRVVHAADATGQAIQESLVQRVKAAANILTLESHIAIDLITGEKLGFDTWRCLGAYVFDRKTRRVEVFSARVVVLATGGAGKVYRYTSNPDLATGDGIAMAWRAGCRVANMEFIQFHPTCLFHPKAKSALVTEALRGEGARLVLANGERFMPRFDKRAELAPRDIVARAIDHEMKRLGADCVHLDVTTMEPEFLRQRFPNVHARCQSFGFDLTREPIPVVPAAHYVCGGVMTDRRGRTDLDGLYSIGETAFTGLHGANRMAGNSLLECVVMAKSAAEDIDQQIVDAPPVPPLPAWDESQVTDSDEEVVVSHNWEELRRFMWDYVGIVRTTKRLQRAQRRADMLTGEISEYYGNFRVHNDLLELRNLAVVASLIIRSAMARHESRGLHYTLDYPRPIENAPPENTVLDPRLPTADRLPAQARSVGKATTS
ncbi:MAG: L-aspartate oxidase [Gammaproteobacteria bacterium]|nr:MAG: L-aspartate oxidase [Gammaproteobacteria bacterium]